MLRGGISFFAKMLDERTDNDFDTTIIAESGAVKGTGKTSFSIETCKEICKLRNYPYDMKKLMILDATEEKIRKLSKELPRGIPIHVDEAIFLAYKRDYNEDASKKFVKFVNICRKYGHPVILNVPWFWDLDKDIRNLADYRVTIVKRGIAIVRQKDINTDTEDLWLRKLSSDIQAKEVGNDMTDIQGVIRGIDKCRNVLAKITFDRLPEKEYNEYRELSMREEGKSLDTNEKRPMVLIKLMTWILLENGYNTTTLAKEINNQLANSHYGKEYSKFKMLEATLKEYSHAWESATTTKLPIIFNNSNNIDKKIEENFLATESLLIRGEDIETKAE